MEKFIRIESTLINVNTITDVHAEAHENLNTTFLIINTNNGTQFMKPLPESIDDITDMGGVFLDMITTFLASKEPDELVLDLDVYDSGNMSENETNSESTENCCENCTYCDTRNDSSKYCVIYDKELSGTACDLYKNAETGMTKQAERTKLREAVTFIQTYCATHLGNCKGCLFSDNYKLGCPLAQLPEDWNTDCLM